MRPVEARALRLLADANRRADRELASRILLEAARKGWPAVVSAALAKGADVGTRDRWGDSLLRIATSASRPSLEVVQLLLNASANAREPGVLAHAAPSTLPLLIAAGADVNGTSATDRPLIRAIAGRNKDDKALLLLEAGADPNLSDDAGRTPLICAAIKGQYRVFEQLLKAGAETMVVDPTGRSVLRLAAESAIGMSMASAEQRQRDCRRIVRRLRSLPPAQPEDVVIAPLVLGDVPELRRQLKAGLKPNARIRGSIGLLGGMQLNDIREMMSKMHLPREQMDESAGGATLLMWSALARQPRMVRLLLGAGADPRLRDGFGRTAYDLAGRWGNRATASILRQWTMGGRP